MLPFFWKERLLLMVIDKNWQFCFSESMKYSQKTKPRQAMGWLLQSKPFLAHFHFQKRNKRSEYIFGFLMFLDIFLPDPSVSGVRSMGPGLCTSVQHLFENLTDVTLADDDSNLIPTDDVDMAILGNMVMQVAPCGGQH